MQSGSLELKLSHSSLPHPKSYSPGEAYEDTRNPAAFVRFERVRSGTGQPVEFLGPIDNDHDDNDGASWDHSSDDASLPPAHDENDSPLHEYESAQNAEDHHDYDDYDYNTAVSVASWGALHAPADLARVFFPAG